MLDHDVAGAGPPVLLVHAGVADRRMWDGVVATLADTHRVIAPDLRGFGGSPLVGAAYSHVDDLLAVLDALDVDRVAVVGASFGGLVSLRLAHAAPDRVVTLVLAAPVVPGWPWSSTMIDFWEAEEAALDAGDIDAAVDLNVRLWAGSDPTVRERVRTMQRRAFDLQLGRDATERSDFVDPAAITTPTLVVVGTEDLSDFHGISERLVATMPAAKRAVVDGAGHLVAMERPAEFAVLVRDFIG